MIEVKCLNCNILFRKKSSEIKRGKGMHFCCQECFKQHKNKNAKINIIKCENCNKEFYKAPFEQRKSKNHFCSRSCAATYNNTHKKFGHRVSKLELFLQEELKKNYSYNFHFNRKDTINSELDIYIPELKLAFELNGIFHYEPIYGPEKLSQIQNNDNRKFQACLEKEIELCVIDTSWIKYNKTKNFEKILNIINSIILKKFQNLT